MSKVLMYSLIILATMTMQTEAMGTCIVGSWQINGSNDTNHVLSLTFYPNGFYVHYEYDADENNIYNGVEYGTYLYDQTTGQMTTSVIKDENDGFGLGGWASDGGSTAGDTFTLVGDSLTIVDGEEITSLYRVKSDDAPIVGGWTASNNVEDHVLSLTFYTNGFYIHYEYDADENNIYNGVEYGTYLYDQTTGQMTTSVIKDENDWSGLSDWASGGDSTSENTFTIIGDSLTIFDGEETVSLYRVKSNSTPIVGGWITSNNVEDHVLSLTFYPNGFYVHYQYDVDENNIYHGVEYGTYLYDQITGQMTTSVIRDENDGFGLGGWASDGGSTAGDTFTLVGDSLTIIDGEETTSLYRVKSDDAPIVGGWTASNNIEDHVLSLTFYTNGFYVHYEYDADENNIYNGVEYGTYLYDRTTGQMTTSVIKDENDGSGLSDWASGGGSIPENTFTIVGDSLTIFDGEETVYLHRVKAVDSDVDCDQMPDAWEQQIMTASGDTITDVSQVNPNDDFDGDGFSNLEEYISGTDPTDSTSFFRITNSFMRTDQSDGFIVEWNSVPNRCYSIFWYTNLMTSHHDVLETEIEYPQNSYTDTVHGAESKGFYTINVRMKE